MGERQLIRQYKRWWAYQMVRFWRIGAVFAILGLALLPTAAFADLTPPDTVELETARVWRHMLEPNDVLMIVVYNAEYGNQTAQPSPDISLTFDFTYYGTSTGNVTATLGNETAYPFFNGGYRRGLVAFYWSDANENKPGWGDLGNITMQGTSLYGGSPPSTSLILTSEDWTSGEQPSTQREDLRQWLLNQLIFTEFNWNAWATAQGYTEKFVELVSTLGGEYYVASTQGQAYLGLSIPNITSMVPLLFMTQTTEIAHEERDWELTQQNIYHDLHTGDPVGDAAEAASELIGGVGAIWATTLIIIGIGIGVILLCTVKWQKLNNGLLIAYVLILLATPEGLFQMGLMALFPMVAVLYIADIVLTKRHT